VALNPDAWDPECNIMFSKGHSTDPPGISQVPLFTITQSPFSVTRGVLRKLEETKNLALPLQR
jgi:hypothetical protein